MNRLEFNKYLDHNYSESNLISHELKNLYPTRWLRIHSLPDSKRYAKSEDETQRILTRQNKIISEIIGEKSEIIIVMGLYEEEPSNKVPKISSKYGFFEYYQSINIHQIYPKQYENNIYYNTFFRTDLWRQNSQNELLRDIAKDKSRAMFICIKSNCIVAPYDGGMDIIVDSQKKRNLLKIKYKDWLSKREDRL